MNLRIVCTPQNLEAMKSAHSKLLDEMEGLNADLKRVCIAALLPLDIEVILSSVGRFFC
jgi:hypothetical protein